MTFDASLVHTLVPLTHGRLSFFLIFGAVIEPFGSTLFLRPPALVPPCSLVLPWYRSADCPESSFRITLALVRLWTEYCYRPV